MIRFFKTSRMVTNLKRRMTHSAAPLSIDTKNFELLPNSSYKGKLIKVLIADAKAPIGAIIKDLREKILRDNPNSLLLWTTLTRRLNAQSEMHVYPGHNFSLVTDNRGETLCQLSKRPNTKVILAERACIPDSRFNKKTADKVWLFDPLFTNVEEEITTWVKKAVLLPNYALFVHVLPLVSTLGINKFTYIKNVSDILEQKVPYSLHRWAYPGSDYYIAASNCNSVTEQAILGNTNLLSQDLYCQDAAIQIVSYLLKQQSGYRHIPETMGLAHGIDPSTIARELYTPPMLC